MLPQPTACETELSRPHQALPKLHNCEQINGGCRLKLLNFGVCWSKAVGNRYTASYLPTETIIALGLQAQYSAWSRHSNIWINQKIYEKVKSNIATLGFYLVLDCHYIKQYSYSKADYIVERITIEYVVNHYLLYDIDIISFQEQNSK